MLMLSVIPLHSIIVKLPLMWTHSVHLNDLKAVSVVGAVGVVGVIGIVGVVVGVGVHHKYSRID
jgi:hypothetical protein